MKSKLKCPKCKHPVKKHGNLCCEVRIGKGKFDFCDCDLTDVEIYEALLNETNTIVSDLYFSDAWIEGRHIQDIVSDLYWKLNEEKKTA